MLLLSENIKKTIYFLETIVISSKNSYLEFNKIIKSIRAHQDYYIKITEGFENNKESLNSIIASKLTKIKIQLLKTKNEQRLYLKTGDSRHKSKFTEYLKVVITELNELSIILE